MSSPHAAPVLKEVPDPVSGPRVLFVIPGEGRGSSMIFSRRQAESVAVEGTPVEVFHLASRTSPVVLCRELRRFRSEIKRLRPVVIHAQYGTVTALFCALGTRLPLVITYRGSDLNPAPPSFGWWGKFRANCGRLLSQVAALRAREIVCVSSQLRDRLWWRRARVRVLPTGVDPAVFRPEPQALARRRLGWGAEERVILFNAGRDPRVKGLDLARAALAEVRRRMPEARLEILDGSTGPECVPCLMSAADCLLVTSVFEGSPTVVQEALACDLPVISVDVGDVAERVRGVRNCVIAAAEPEVLGRALADILDPPRRSNGRLKIAEFSSRHIAGELKELYLKTAKT
jgi:teichuronic acid biosynthesis glycosyltransferase TuaC